MSTYFILIGLSFFCPIFSMPVAKPATSSDADIDGAYLLDMSGASRNDATKFLIEDNANGEGNPRLLVKRERSELLIDPKKLKYLAKHLECYPDCVANNKDYDKINQIFANIDDDRALSKIISWTTKQLENLYGLSSVGSYSGVNIWNSVNLSGRREGPLYAEEPRYVLVRREEEYEPKLGRDYMDDPFIPPRGRKHLINLSDIFSRYDLFVPNRGKKDKIRDIFKYDDLFFPNRGKRQGMSKYINYNENNALSCEELNYKCCPIVSQHYICNTIHSSNKPRINYVA